MKIRSSEIIRNFRCVWSLCLFKFTSASEVTGCHFCIKVSIDKFLLINSFQWWNILFHCMQWKHHWLKMLRLWLFLKQMVWLLLWFLIYLQSYRLEWDSKRSSRLFSWTFETIDHKNLQSGENYAAASWFSCFTWTDILFCFKLPKHILLTFYNAYARKIEMVAKWTNKRNVIV